MNDFILTILIKFSIKSYIFDILLNFPAKIFFWSDLVDSRVPTRFVNAPLLNFKKMLKHAILYFEKTTWYISQKLYMVHFIFMGKSQKGRRRNSKKSLIFGCSSHWKCIFFFLHIFWGKIGSGRSC